MSRGRDAWNRQAGARGTRRSRPGGRSRLTLVVALTALAAMASFAYVRMRPVPAAESVAPVQNYGYEVVNAYPHDPEAFTQGLLFRDGYLFESTGLNGRSTVRKVELETGRVLQERPLAPEFFGEGLADWSDRLIQLTWQSKIGFAYDLMTFEPLGTFGYAGEGWGLARDGTRLVMSDGSASLRFLDPTTFEERGRLAVADSGRPVFYLNELEVVRGQILANIWQTDRIARIDPTSGRVTGWIDLSGLLPASDRTTTVDVLNGIAYDEQSDRLFVTGKLWPRLFEIRLIAR